MSTYKDNIIAYFFGDWTAAKAINPSGDILSFAIDCNHVIPQISTVSFTFTGTPSGTIFFEWGGTSGDALLSIADLTFGDDIWVLTIGTPGTPGMAVWQNGFKVGSKAEHAAAVPDGIFGVGNDPAGNGDVARRGLFAVFDVILPDREIVELSADPFGLLRRYERVGVPSQAAVVTGRVMSRLAGYGGLAGHGGIAGPGGGLAG